jgi:hypothetical protein
MCGIERTKENWRPSGALCAKCYYKAYKKTKTMSKLSQIKKLANEIVINYNRKTHVGLLCACRDLVKFYDENNITFREEEE